MRVPRDKSLASWIRDLVREGKEVRFYQTEEWRELREEVLRDNHWECSSCKRKSPAVYSKAAQVHHVNEIKKRPELALSRTYRDAEGAKDNLVPLCLDCHNREHGRYGRAEDGPQLNEERW